MHSITVKITKEGEIKAHIEGVLGKSCDGLLNVLTQLGSTLEEGHTDDWDTESGILASAKPWVNIC